MLTIYDGERSHFWQWDINQKLKVDAGHACEVHFRDPGGAAALVVETYTLDGQTVANVPNKLLQEDDSILAWVYVCEGDECTKHEARFAVWPRQKPADYVYTETEIKRFDDLEKRVEELEKNGGSGTGGVSPEELTKAVNAALEEAKESGDFNGADGQDGADGKSAYQYAKDGGYTGTEAEFAAKLAKEIPDAYTLPVASADTLGGVKVGSGLQMDGEVLGVVPEKQFELIETITLETDVESVIRTSLPDGTPLKLKQLFMKVLSPAYTENRRLYINIGNTNAPGVWSTDRLAYITNERMINTTGDGSQLVVSDNNGKMTSSYIPPSAKGATMNIQSNIPFVDSGSIMAIRVFAYSNTTNTIPAGTTFEIWGVRANA